VLVRLAVFVLLAGCAPAQTPVVEVGALAPAASPVTLPPSAQSSPNQIPEETPNELPFAVNQLWTGHYTCAQGETQLTLRIERVSGADIDAVFEFYHPPSGAEGSYRIHGKWSAPKRYITFKPGEWLDHPSGYITVGMTGTVSGEHFSGTIDNDTCKDFSLSREGPEEWDED